MTVVVAFLCKDGAVVASDSMITTSMGQLPIAHMTGLKVEVLDGNQVFAFAGDQGQGARFRIMANGSHGALSQAAHPIDYPILLTQSLVQQFHNTGIGGAINLATVLAYPHAAGHQCCVFEGAIQPRLLDQAHFFVAIGSGKLAADPFLRFLVDIFSPKGPPTVREAVFLAAWTVEHVIQTNPGGVAGPTRIAVLQSDGNGGWLADQLASSEIEEHKQAMESAIDALRIWREQMQSGAATDETNGPPVLTPNPP